MAESKGEGSSSRNEQIVEDLMSQLKQNVEQFKKCVQELNEADERIRSLRRKNEELMHNVAELAKEITKPQLREAVIKVFGKEEEVPLDYWLAAIEKLTLSLKDFLKEHQVAAMEIYEEEKEYTLDELLDRLSETAQQVIDLKD